MKKRGITDLFRDDEHAEEDPEHAETFCDGGVPQTVGYHLDERE